MELGLSLRRCNEEKELPPNHLVIDRFTLSGAATVGQWLHSDHLRKRLHDRSSPSRRNLDPGADIIARRNICVDRYPSLVALMFSNAARLFPRKAEARTMIETAELSSSNNIVASARVLVVDDEVCIADLLSEMLRLLGFTPTTCNSPLAALDLLAKAEFDVVLSDYRMPHLNGDEFFRRVASEHPYLRSRFVFLTGDTMSEGTHDFMAGQGSRYICKPFDIATVQQVITEIVAQEAA